MEELFYTRAFLNRARHNGSAHVLGRVQVGSDEVSAALTIADCSRSVTLDLDLYEGSTRAERRNGLHKVSLLRATVVDFATAVEEAYARYEASARQRR